MPKRRAAANHYISEVLEKEDKAQSEAVETVPNESSRTKRKRTQKSMAEVDSDHTDEEDEEPKSRKQSKGAAAKSKAAKMSDDDDEEVDADDSDDYGSRKPKSKAAAKKKPAAAAKKKASAKRASYQFDPSMPTVDIPDDIWLYIMTFLPPRDVAVSSKRSCCQRFALLPTCTDIAHLLGYLAHTQNVVRIHTAIGHLCFCTSSNQFTHLRDTAVHTASIYAYPRLTLT